MFTDQYTPLYTQQNWGWRQGKCGLVEAGAGFTSIPRGPARRSPDHVTEWEDHKHAACRGSGSDNVTSPRSLVPWSPDTQSGAWEGGRKPASTCEVTRKGPAKSCVRVCWAQQMCARAPRPCTRTSSLHVLKRAENCRLHLNFKLLLNFEFFHKLLINLLTSHQIKPFLLEIFKCFVAKLAFFCKIYFPVFVENRRL